MNFWYFSNNTADAVDMVSAGIGQVCIDIERNGKLDRQRARNTFISTHKLEDVKDMANTIGSERVICRINPIHDGSYDEIRKCIDYGASTVILPYFRNLSEVEDFLSILDGRAKSTLLIETCHAFMLIPTLAKLSAVDSLYIGLNDLSLDSGIVNMIDLVSDGWMEVASSLIAGQKPFGFGGISSLNDSSCQTTPASILNVHKAIGTSSLILSRSFFRYCQALSVQSDCSLAQVVSSEISLILQYLRK